MFISNMVTIAVTLDYIIHVVASFLKFIKFLLPHLLICNC